MQIISPLDSANVSKYGHLTYKYKTSLDSRFENIIFEAKYSNAPAAAAFFYKHHIYMLMDLATTEAYSEMFAQGWQKAKQSQVHLEQCPSFPSRSHGSDGTVTAQ